MTRHTRNKQLIDINKKLYGSYEINMSMPTSIMYEKGSGNLDKDFFWLRNPRCEVSVERWKKKRYKEKDRFNIHTNIENLIFFGNNGFVKSKYK
ncbi:hypothetical protein [Bacillus phage Megatron]|uniref:Uncharacterized protein n=1 Tax=Bacillus phage Megatron TaxID=1486661 RepID=A0A024B2A9_9CAUD|nr:hypothetical protein FP75_gp008 [Bacillus phage Megatron]AHZ10590.1 hypothetical protein [Bacillus phage Megatron]